MRHQFVSCFSYSLRCQKYAISVLLLKMWKIPIDSGIGHKGRMEAEEMSSDQILIIIFKLIFINVGWNNKMYVSQAGMWPQRENKGWGNVLIAGFVFNIGCCCWNKQSKCIMIYFPSLYQIALFKRFTLQTLYLPNIWKTMHLIKHMDKISRSKILAN